MGRFLLLMQYHRVIFFKLLALCFCSSYFVHWLYLNKAGKTETVLRANMQPFVPFRKKKKGGGRSGEVEQENTYYLESKLDFHRPNKLLWVKTNPCNYQTNYLKYQMVHKNVYLVEFYMSMTKGYQQHLLPFEYTHFTSRREGTSIATVRISPKFRNHLKIVWCGIWTYVTKI